MILVIIAKLINFLANAAVLLIIVKVILSYILSPFHPVRQAINRIVEPVLTPIRRVVPPVGMFDFSPLILIVIIEVLSMLLVNLLVR